MLYCGLLSIFRSILAPLLLLDLPFFLALILPVGSTLPGYKLAFIVLAVSAQRLYLIQNLPWKPYSMGRHLVCELR